MTDRYVIGRDGVFATLWDRQERRLLRDFENADGPGIEDADV
ncbi:hypothetical protein [Streptomyces sp. NPDC048527]